MNGIVPIAGLLASLGYRGEAAQETARMALVESGLTTSKKTNIAAYKQEQVEELLAARFIRVCESNECGSKARTDSRQRVLVPKPECELCAGGGTGQALTVMLDRLHAAGVRRLLVVGGSPTVHKELKELFSGSGVDLDIVRGDRTIDSRRAEALANRADVIVVWGRSILAHKVSTLFTDPKYGHKRAILARRGIGSFAEAVTRHLQLTKG